MKKLLCLTLVLSSVLLSAQSRGSSLLPATQAATETASEKLTADTPKTTVPGNSFVAPEGWTIRVKGEATILEATEGDSWVALVDMKAKTAEEALAAAWKIPPNEHYWTEDIIEPAVEVTSKGTIRVPPTPGLGYVVKRDFVEKPTVRRDNWGAPAFVSPAVEVPSC